MSLLEQLEASDIEPNVEFDRPTPQVETRGRPRGSLGNGSHAHLNPQENRVALLRAGGMSVPSIAIVMEKPAETIYNILERPHVAHFLVKITAQTAQEIGPVARRISEELEILSCEALDREVNVMRTLDDVGDQAFANGDHKTGIRAKLGVLSTTQDILDRAGKRAPTRTIGAMVHAVAPEQLERLERILTDSIEAKEGKDEGTRVIDIDLGDSEHY